MDEIFEKVQTLVDRYEEVSEMLSDPEVIGDTKRFMELSKEEGSLRETVDTFKRYQAVVTNLEEDKEMLKEKLDPEMEELTKEEIKELTSQKTDFEDQLKIMLLPKDPNDEKNIIMEIHGAAGGDEAALFAGNLYEMYSRYAEKQGWKIQIIDENRTEIGGYKELVLMIQGDNVYSKLKFENGAHRVQRVPETESAGRVHTSTATVGVMPEYEDVDIKIEDKDLRVDVYRSSGAGGQHINKTSSAVRMTHLPTGVVVAMQDERSQQQNRAKAMEILKTRVYNFYASQNEAEYSEMRKTAVGTGDRSERIRTYNYPQNRVTDHRIGLSLNKLDRIMNGELEDVIDALVIADQAAKLEELKN
ncbi:peptide chain release factor 1 [Weissella koreensis]|uniref:Peptide chain release factor 1 n=1 Tax=Weissella koreensis TaxID=165096 RepID=A0A7H1MLG2_9LACO|nr:peptide chain release factor 1 [Weissella koreensis]AEJ23459.1 peptide chain release factor 1 [Weissella koreensis KACC 15510]AVH75094.1 peptide chain release factor 1 [Weissella koreensis]EJF33504.1 peptide chain release factor 1 [Weissella koreensis KCTC 3621]MCZ9310954.1 peptide chain release factor 1 [Weissella koreensis]QGN20320.1 peptide chain release factor 1 [Weissella koreensis]